MGKYKTKVLTNSIIDKDWDNKAKEFVKTFKHTCWACDIVDSRCTVKIKHQHNPIVISGTVCLCPECFKAVNRMMFDENDFLPRLNDLKRIMGENDNNRIFTYSALRDFKEDYLNKNIELYKKTQDPNLQHELIKKVLSLKV